MKDLYSIGEVAAQTGLSVDTLRVWERRYAQPVPVRLPSGHRRFTAEQLRWLRRVSEALHLGFRPSQAVRASSEELDAWITKASGGAVDEPLLDGWLAAVRELSNRELRREIEEAWESCTPAEFLDTRLAPFLTRIGRSWADGEISVRHERMASETVNEFLRERRAACPSAESQPVVLLATLAGERHALGIRMAALTCALSGVQSVMIGSDLPEEEIVLAARELGAQAVVLSVSLACAGRETDRRLGELARELPEGVQLIVGGRGVRPLRRGREGVLNVREYGELESWMRELRGEASQGDPQPAPTPAPPPDARGFEAQGLSLQT